MIETKEKYKEFKEAGEKFPNLRIWSSDIKAIVETIEALREVARYGRHIPIDGSGLSGCFVYAGGECSCGWAEAKDALPDWLTDE